MTYENNNIELYHVPECAMMCINSLPNFDFIFLKVKTIKLSKLYIVLFILAPEYTQSIIVQKYQLQQLKFDF